MSAEGPAASTLGPAAGVAPPDPPTDRHRIQDAARRLVVRVALALQVDEISRPGAWFWRLFIRPAPIESTGSARRLAAVLDLLARLLRLPPAERPGTWAQRLFFVGEEEAFGPQPNWRQQLRRRLTQAWRSVQDTLPGIDHEALGRRLEAMADTPWLRSRAARVAGLALSAFAFWLAVTTPLNWAEQLGFALFIVLLAVQVRNTSGTVPTLILMALALVASCRYGWWRITQSMDLEPGWETVLGFTLLGAEVYAWLIMLLGFVQCAWPLKRKPSALPEALDRWPTVDVYIPTYNEPLSVVQPTVLAAKLMDWPAGRMRIYLLDDGRRETMRRFAAMAGVEYLVRPDNRHAKAGNLNHALQRTGGEYVAIFDCDHLPVRSFLQTTVGALVRDPGCAMVQTPHHFFSADPFERNLKTFRRVPNEGSLFYGLVQDGNDFWNATFFCGSCAVLRREPLERIGGIAVETVTEDAHTALKLHRLGYRTAYINMTQAAGLATESLAQHVAQRIRWARGMAQIFRIDNPMLGRGLNLMQRLCYSNSMLHFFYGIPRLVFLTAPLAYLYFELHIIRSPAAIFALYLLPHLVLPHIATARMQGAYRHSFWAEVYETVLAWYITLPTTIALLNPAAGSFNVTDKGSTTARSHLDWSISRPYFGLILLNGMGLVIGLFRLFSWNRFEAGTVVMNLAWTTFNMLMLGAAIGVAYERRQLRGFHRVSARLPVVLVQADGHTHHCLTANYSLRGLGLRMPSNARFERNEPVQVILKSGSAEHAFAARITAQRGINVGLQFGEQNLQQQEQLIRCTFGRADAWAHWHEQYEPDLPLRGLGEIAVRGLQGYAGLLQSLWRSVRRRLIYRDQPQFEAGAP